MALENIVTEQELKKNDKKTVNAWCVYDWA